MSKASAVNLCDRRTVSRIVIGRNGLKGASVMRSIVTVFVTIGPVSQNPV
jgi:hypothetical protein